MNISGPRSSQPAKATPVSADIANVAAESFAKAMRDDEATDFICLT